MPYKFNPFTGNLDIEGPIITGSGTVSAAADGTQQVPGINFANDLNTGIYRPAADNLAFSTGGTGRLFIDSSGRVGIGTSSPGALLNLQSDSAASLRIKNTLNNTPSAPHIELLNNDDEGLDIRVNRSGATGIVTFACDNAARFNTGGSESLRIDTSGRVLVGTSSARTDLIAGTRGGRVQVEAASSTSTDAIDNSSLCLTMGSSAPQGSANIFFTRTKSDSLGGVTSVANNDILGGLYFQGTDGTDAVSAALIKAEVDGTPGANDMPGRIILATTADGASSPTERMRVDADGRLLLNTQTEGNESADNLTIADNGNCGITIRSGPTNDGNIFFSDGTSGNAEFRGRVAYDHAADSMRFDTAASEAVRIDSSGRVLVGTSSAFETSTNAILQLKGAANQTPVLALARNDNSIVDNNNLGQIAFYSLDGGIPVKGAHISAFASQDHSATARGTDLAFATIEQDTAGGVIERMRIDSSGRLLVGTTSSTSSALLTVQGNATSSTGAARLNIARGQTFTSNDALLGAIEFTDSSRNVFGQIECRSDATVAAGSDHPGRLVFSTTADGASSPTTRMTIDSSGNVGIGTTNPTKRLQVTDGTYSNFYIAPGYNSDAGTLLGVGGAEYLSFATGGLANERMRIDSSGRLLVGMTSPLASTSTAYIQSAKQIVAEQGVLTTNGGWSMLPTSRVTFTQAADKINGHTVEIDLSGINEASDATMLRVAFSMRRGNTSSSFNQKSEYMGLWDATKISTDQHIDATHIVERELTVTSITYASDVVTLTFDTDNVRSFTARAFEYCTTGNLYTAA